jgi:hypothetical protein
MMRLVLPRVEYGEDEECENGFNHSVLPYRFDLASQFFRLTIRQSTVCLISEQVH